MNQFEIVNESDGFLKIRVLGILNERTVWPEVDMENLKRLMVDVDQVSSINSMGILGWIRWWGKLMKSSPDLVSSISCMRPNFISCASAVKDFIPKNTMIESFYVFYVCDEDNQSIQILKNRESDYSNGVLVLEESIQKELNGEKATFELSCIPSKDFRCLNVEVKVV